MPFSRPAPQIGTRESDDQSFPPLDFASPDDSRQRHRLIDWSMTPYAGSYHKVKPHSSDRLMPTCQNTVSKPPVPRVLLHGIACHCSTTCWDWSSLKAHTVCQMLKYSLAGGMIPCPCSRHDTSTGGPPIVEFR